MELAKDISDLCPELIEKGGLANAVHAALRRIASSLSVSELDKSIPFIVYARVESGYRFSQISVGAQTRMFSFDFWSHGVQLAKGSTPEILEMAVAIDKWIATGCSTGELANSFRFVAALPPACGSAVPGTAEQLLN